MRRERGEESEGKDLWEIIKEIGVEVMKNKEGWKKKREEIKKENMEWEVFGKKWIKMEVIGEKEKLKKEKLGMVEEERIMWEEGFEVFKYMKEDIIVEERIIEEGWKVMMKWGEKIG